MRSMLGVPCLAFHAWRSMLGVPCLAFHAWRSMLGAPLLALASLLLPFATQAQTQAACTFNFFSLQTTITAPDGTPVFMQPRGINDFGTVVGVGSRGSAGSVGLIRWANGGFTHVQGTRALTARNDHGTSIGTDRVNRLFREILVNGQTITPIVLDVNQGSLEILARGINKWGTIVGLYYGSDAGHGFKLEKNGTVHILDFPGTRSSSTAPQGINDNGTVVGHYEDPNVPLTHGFIFHNGQWATLDYPNAPDTQLIGITNAGKVIGYVQTNTFTGYFLYENGIFKVISLPNGGPMGLLSISPKQGLILGITGGAEAFIAQCQ
jgi:probable HAF family extracellular repeat protein